MSDTPADTHVDTPADTHVDTHVDTSADTSVDTATDTSEDTPANMPSPNEVSKKELLAQTGISYGQLYRWKREGLIPEEWFVKRSAFTGQETFFPRELILERVKAIQSMKDGLSLSEIRDQFSTEGGQGNLKSKLRAATGLDEAFIDSLGIDLGSISLPEQSLAAIASLFTALNKKGTDDDTKREVLVSVINALANTVVRPPSSKTTNPAEEE